jgi:glutaminase
MELWDLIVSPETSFISVGHLQPAEAAKRLVIDAHERFQSIDQGQVSPVYSGR